MGSYISLTIPQPERSNLTYAQTNPRFKKNNSYLLFALSWMEHFVDVLSPFDEVLNKIHQDRKKSASTSLKLMLDVSEIQGRPQKISGQKRVSKDNLFMITALWMEDLVNKIPELGEEETKTPEKTRQKSYRNVGAVLVLPNDVGLAADCSRNGVHAVARLLMKHYDKAEGCQMFMSRKPCPLCAKLLIQAKVKRVLYLPFEPEYYRDGKENEDYNNKKRNEVDNLFTASPIAQTRFVLDDEKGVADQMRQDETLQDDVRREVEGLKDHFEEKFRFKKEWLDSIETALPWPGFNKEKMREKLLKNIEIVMYWMARVHVFSGGSLNENFKQFSEDSGDFDPKSNTIHEKQARHFMTMARFLAGRSDDPKTGVGVVIVSPEMENVAFGWNGYPRKALYGEFSRGGKTEANNKYPYVIHAEQNALLMRNTKDIKGSILFVTKSPCNECAPLIAIEGVKTVVVGEKVKLPDETQTNNDPQQNILHYDLFPEMVKKGTFTCYHKGDKAADSSQSSTADH